jgi:hypothetical protein
LSEVDAPERPANKSSSTGDFDFLLHKTDSMPKHWKKELLDYVISELESRAEPRKRKLVHDLISSDDESESATPPPKPPKRNRKDPLSAEGHDSRNGRTPRAPFHQLSPKDLSFLKGYFSFNSFSNSL